MRECYLFHTTNSTVLPSTLVCITLPQLALLHSQTLSKNVLIPLWRSGQW